MKILMPVDPEIPVPPKLYGGVERLVDGLAAEYKKAGHTVILLANPESTCQHADKIYTWPALKSRGWGNVLKNALRTREVYKLEKPDVVHSFARLMYLYPTLFTSNVSFLMTYGREISVKSTSLATTLGGKRIHFTSAAAHMLNHLPNKQKFTPVYNFTPTHFYTPNKQVEREYLMFLGRIEDIKGTKEAIEVALATNNKLLIAGNIQPGHDAYFNQYVKPHLNNNQIQYVGPVNDEQKRFWLQRSKALLFPIKWEEPFGIVMIEAMSCGTPVIAFNRGSVPEVVLDGKNGFICNNTQDMVEAVYRLPMLNSEFIRSHCVEMFSSEVIAAQYLRILTTLSSANE